MCNVHVLYWIHSWIVAIISYPCLWNLIINTFPCACVILNTFIKNDSSLITEKFFRNLIKSNRNQNAFTTFRLIWNKMDVHFVIYQSEHGKYNLISVWFYKIPKIFFGVYACYTHHCLMEWWCWIDSGHQQWWYCKSGDVSHPRKFPAWTIPTLDDSHPRQFISRLISTPDNSQPR